MYSTLHEMGSLLMVSAAPYLPRFLVLNVRHTRCGIHLVVPGLSRLLNGRTGGEHPIATEWSGLELVLGLDEKPVLVLCRWQAGILMQSGVATIDRLLLTDHNYRYRTWIGPLSAPPG